MKNLIPKKSRQLAYNIYSNWVNPNGLKRSLRRLVSRPKFGFQPETFDAEFYQTTYPDTVDCADPYGHFIAKGYFEGRIGRFFDCDWYARQYPDIAQSGIQPLDHYLRFGQKEKRRARFCEVSLTFPQAKRQNYSVWIENIENPARLTSVQIAAKLKSFAHKPLISIILPTYKSNIKFLDQAIQSVIAQSYPNWELCIADDASQMADLATYLTEIQKSDSRIKILQRGQNGHISLCSNDALGLATGEFVAFLDHDDLLDDNAILLAVEVINQSPDVAIIYSDEDKIDESNFRFDPYFKPDFNYELLLAQNYICHFTLIRRELVNQVNGFKVGLEGAQDHDLFLRIVEKISPKQIKHIPSVLYHWRAISGSTALNIDQKSYAVDAGVRAISEHLQRRNLKAKILPHPEAIGHYRVFFEISPPLPKVCIIIPTRDHKIILENCVTSVLEKSTYPNFEILIVNNQSEEPETKLYFQKIKSDKIQIIDYDAPFNYSKLNNFAAAKTDAQYLLFLNNDIVIISPNWIEEMLSFAQFEDVGCVGARLWYPDDTLQHAGVVLGIGGVAGHVHNMLPKGELGYFGRAVHHQEFSAVTAACLMLRKSYFDEVGGFEEGLSVAFNDIDLCLKIRESGKRNIYTPFAELYHLESKSRGTEDNPQKIARFNSEVDFMKNKWGSTLTSDPHYNPNLSLRDGDFDLQSMEINANNF